MNMIIVPNITLKQVRQIAIDADCDPRTATRALLGLPCRPSLRERIVGAAVKHGVAVETLPKLTTTASGDTVVRP